MNFIKVLQNTNNCRQALFERDGQHFMYSYVDNEYAHETMVFRCGPNGDDVDMMDIVAYKGYVESDKAMQDVTDTLMEFSTNNE